MSNVPLIQIPKSSSGGVIVSASASLLPFIYSWHGHPYAAVINGATVYIANGTATAGAINVLPIFIPYQMTITKFTTNIQAAAIGQTFAMALYNLSGTLIFGTNVSMAAIGAVAKTFAGFTLAAGWYLSAVSSSSTTAGCTTGFTLFPVYTAAINLNAARMGVAANTYAASTWPNTLGAITKWAPVGNLQHAGFIIEP